jgi:hypothetical protein
MAKKDGGEPPPDENPVDESPPQPGVKPPGMFVGTPTATLAGVPHLQAVMGSSGPINVERLCEDAAVYIEKLQAGHQDEVDGFRPDRDRPVP